MFRHRIRGLEMRLRAARSNSHRRRGHQLWMLEGLEGRVLLSGSPTNYTVNLLSDTGASSGTDATTGNPSGDLRYCINQANANTNPEGSVIQFDPTVFNPNFNGQEVIALSSTLELSETAGPEMIEGPALNNPPPEPLSGVAVSIGDNNAIEVFTVDAGVTATFSRLEVSSVPNYIGDKGGAPSNWTTRSSP
jgi:hypothetical protein